MGCSSFYSPTGSFLTAAWQCAKPKHIALRRGCQSAVEAVVLHSSAPSRAFA